ncbi:DsbE family thiol:disulfide interchange protein [Moraxella nasovis]|nr:DsbE family thiol:disulfide interchange protein [Moraxella nasovis]UNU73084.1 DsbE family thiol:disulfide interchange protein [Moraxella nasovis]
MKKSTQKWLFIIPLVVFAGLIAMLSLRQDNVQKAGTSDIVNTKSTYRQLPSFSLPLLSDPSRTMTNNDLPKTPFILNIWGSWCLTCRVEHPFLMELHDQGVLMIGVNYKDEPEDALTYLNEHSDPFLYSVQDYTGDLALDLGLTGAPESFIVDQDGVVRLHIVGEIHADNYANKIKPCMIALADDSLDEAAKNQACGG